jgi:ribosome-associated protein
LKQTETKKLRRRTAKLTVNDVIITSIQDKKGENIVSLDLRKINEAVADYFIICEADNTTQVRAIAEHMEKQTEELLGEKPWHREGLQNMEWVLIDYISTVVHIFRKDIRQFYQLEELWSDAIMHEHN